MGKFWGNFGDVVDFRGNFGDVVDFLYLFSIFTKPETLKLSTTSQNFTQISPYLSTRKSRCPRSYPNRAA